MRTRFIALLFLVLFGIFSITLPVQADGNNDSISLNIIEQNVDTATKPNLETKKNEEENIFSGDKVKKKAFLSEFLALQTAILAFLIPLAFDVVTRISEKYKSEIVIKHFQREKIFLILIFVLFVNILYLLSLGFFEINVSVMSGISFFLTILSVFLLFGFLILLRSYSSSSKYIKEKLLNEAKKLIK